MQLIADANILIASLLKDGKTRELLLDDALEIFAPEHLLTELKHLLKNPGIRKRIGLNDADLNEFASSVLSRIRFVPEKIFLPRIKEALALTAHPEDAPYAALALALHIPLWSNDRNLKEYSLPHVKVLTTQELIDRLTQ